MEANLFSGRRIFRKAIEAVWIMHVWWEIEIICKLMCPSRAVTAMIEDLAEVQRIGEYSDPRSTRE
ncbi:MAG: hypothetical protein ACYDDO_08415 [Acidiferrobacterales bacterium]